MAGVVSVGYKYLYDLYYRIRRAKLKNEVYSIDFRDWVKAGIAYNVLGVKEPGRKVSYFARLYKILRDESFAEHKTDIMQGVFAFYEDLFKLYQDHLVGQLHASQRRMQTNKLEVDRLLLLPTFEQEPGLLSVFQTVDVELASYECKHLPELLDTMATIYAREGTDVFQMMALYFDAGVYHEDEVLLGRIIYE